MTASQRPIHPLPDLATAPGRLGREWRTLAAMLAIACRDLHGGRRGALCAPCDELRHYAHQRLTRCPFGPGKPTCANCKVHCYKPQMRERVRQVMRHAGPKMLLRHPVLALMHLLVDERRPAPGKPAQRRPAVVATTAEPRSSGGPPTSG
jgi:hypothetical protein